MQHNLFAIVTLFLSVSAEVPQEHSHDLILSRARVANQSNKKGNNPSSFAKVDPVIGLLADKGVLAGIQKVGQKSNPACVHQIIADSCLTNAKRENLAKDAKAACIQYAALERNTGLAGTASAICKDQPKNKELLKVKAHQDPGSKGAAAINKAVELEVAKQMFALGFSANDSADLAQRTATFSGTLDRKASKSAGNSCDAPPGFTKLGGDVPSVFANKDGTVFGEKIKNGQKIDCTTLAALNGDKVHMTIPQASKQELIKSLGK